MNLVTACLALDGAAAALAAATAVALARDNAGGAALCGVAALLLAVGGVAYAIRGVW